MESAELKIRRRSFQTGIRRALCAYFETRNIQRQTLYSDRQHGIGGAYARFLIGRHAVITVDPEVVHRAQKLLESCEHCHPDDAEIPFDWVLAEVTGKQGPHEFILTEPARCPWCKHQFTEKTLVEPK